MKRFDSRPARRFRARGTMMLALACWLARVGGWFASLWHRARGNSRMAQPAPAATKVPTERSAQPTVLASVRLTRAQVFIARRRARGR